MGACSTKTATNDQTKDITTNQAKANTKNIPSKADQSNNDQIMSSNEPPTTGLQEFELKKHRTGCTGMFWRSDPTGTTPLASNNDWPRDGAKLRGRVVTVDGEKWLLATHVLQKGGSQWKKAPQGAAMPFEYNQHYYLG